ncbi:MAG: hypothetical protein JOZ25_09485 [Actinobacteria bacterium]|nr:hypothetical protein [Actinomycetota bacterium]
MKGTLMQNASYIDRNTQAAVESGGMSYIAADVPENVTLQEYARVVAQRTQRYASGLRRIAGRSGNAGSAAETTAGGW